MDQTLRQQVLELKFAKRYGEAVALVRELAGHGDLAAKVMIARMSDAAGLTRTEADKLVEAAHLALKPGDIAAHLELYGAYAEGLGDAPYDQKASRSFEHLLAAAEGEAGSSYSLTVARMYRAGSLAVPVDLAKAAWWYRKAALQGSPVALDELKALSDG